MNISELCYKSEVGGLYSLQIEQKWGEDLHMIEREREAGREKERGRMMMHFDVNF
jgi:hypothetical protein